MREVNRRRKEDGRYAHSEETKKKLSRVTTEYMARGIVSRVSRLEKKVGSLIETIGLKVVPQYGVRGDRGRYVAVADFFLPEFDLLVEVNGTYWHADPRVYPNGPKTAAQIRTKRRYDRKMRRLKSLGYRVVEIWEKDFKKDPQKAVQKALGIW